MTQSARVKQVEGIFDVAPSPTSREEWEVDLPIEDRPWNIGLIVGPSGCGKTSIARDLWPADYVVGHEWPADRAIVDAFPREMGIQEITGILSSVGFSSPPAWRRPFGVLSTGQQFRVTVARALAESPDLAVIDEFTSVVDRTVVQIGSAAVAKAVRASGKRLVAVACHYDIIDWLQPDWIFQPADGSFAWRSVQPRPPIVVTIRRVHHSAWTLFKKHHYMTGNALKNAHTYVGFIAGAPVALLSVSSFPHAISPGWSFHRAVVLPDFQGCGLGVALTDTIAAIYAATGKPVRGVTAHPALRIHLARSPLWTLAVQRNTRLSEGIGSRGGDPTTKFHTARWCAGAGRSPSSFRWVGPKDMDAALGFGLSVAPTAGRKVHGG